MPLPQYSNRSNSDASLDQLSASEQLEELLLQVSNFEARTRSYLEEATEDHDNEDICSVFAVYLREIGSLLERIRKLQIQIQSEHTQTIQDSDEALEVAAEAMKSAKRYKEKIAAVLEGVVNKSKSYKEDNEDLKERLQELSTRMKALLERIRKLEEELQKEQDRNTSHQRRAHDTEDERRDQARRWKRRERDLNDALEGAQRDLLNAKTELSIVTHSPSAAQAPIIIHPPAAAPAPTLDLSALLTEMRALRDLMSRREADKTPSTPIVVNSPAPDNSALLILLKGFMDKLGNIPEAIKQLNQQTATPDLGLIQENKELKKLLDERDSQLQALHAEVQRFRQEANSFYGYWQEALTNNTQLREHHATLEQALADSQETIDNLRRALRTTIGEKDRAVADRDEARDQRDTNADVRDQALEAQNKAEKNKEKAEKERDEANDEKETAEGKKREEEEKKDQAIKDRDAEREATNNAEKNLESANVAKAKAEKDKQQAEDERDQLKEELKELQNKDKSKDPDPEQKENTQKERENLEEQLEKAELRAAEAEASLSDTKTLQELDQRELKALRKRNKELEEELRAVRAQLAVASRSSAIVNTVTIPDNSETIMSLYPIGQSTQRLPAKAVKLESVHISTRIQGIQSIVETLDLSAAQAMRLIASALPNIEILREIFEQAEKFWTEKNEFQSQDILLSHKSGSGERIIRMIQNRLEDRQIPLIEASEEEILLFELAQAWRKEQLKQEHEARNGRRLLPRLFKTKVPDVTIDIRGVIEEANKKLRLHQRSYGKTLPENYWQLDHENQNTALERLVKRLLPRDNRGIQIMKVVKDVRMEQYKHRGVRQKLSADEEVELVSERMRECKETVVS
jgi:hypothetical protein